MISTLKTRVSYTTKLETQGGASQSLNPITVRSQDGFTFPVDVRVIYHIEPDDAPRVVAFVGDDEMILERVMTPAVRAIFRNNAEKVKALDYVQQRSKQESQSADMLKTELDKYGISIDAVLIGDVGDQESLGQLLKTQTDREIALQEQKTFEEQQRAAEKAKALAKNRTGIRGRNAALATASYSVQVAEQEKQQLIIEAEAEGPEQIKTVAEGQGGGLSEILRCDRPAKTPRAD